MGNLDRTGWRRRGIIAVLAAAVAVIGIVVPASGVSAGGDAQGAPALSGAVDAGFGGLFVPGRPVPIRVTLSASQLSAGRLTVGMGTRVTEVIDFEVTGGSSEDHWVLLGPPPGDGLLVEASARIDGRDVDLDSAAVQWEPQVDLVGVLPGLRASTPRPREASTSILSRQLQFVPLEPALLDLGPEALAALDSVAATVDDLAGLSEAHRRTVLAWLHTGGTLYVDAPEGPLPELPDALQPVAGMVRSGTGAVVPTGGALAAGRWSEVIVPGAHRSVHEDRDASANLPFPDLQSELIGIDLGRDLPPLPGLLAVIGIYIVLVGPLAYLASRRRVMVRWAAIPVLAGLATGVLVLNGEGLGTDTTADVVDVIETGPGTALASTRVVLSSGGGDRSIQAPPGWAIRSDDQFGFEGGFGFGFGSGDIVQQRSADGVELSLSAPPGGIGYVSAGGPVAFDGALEVTATTAADGTVTGEVRNATRVTLTDVGVFAGRTASTVVGTLEPGASAAFELERTNQFRFAVDPFREAWPNGGTGGFAGPATTMAFGPGPPPPPPGFGPIVSETCDEFGNCEQCDDQGNCFGFGRDVIVEPAMECDEFGNCFPVGTCLGAGCEQGTVRPASLNHALWGRGTNAMPPGLITAVGWTDDLGPMLDLGGGVDVKGSRTAIVGRAAPVAAGDRLADAASVRTMVAFENVGTLDIVFGFRVPPTVGDRPVDAGRLRLDIPRMFHRVSILRPGGEHVVVDLGDLLEPNRSGVVVPPDALVSGHVFVRASMEFAPPPPGRELVIYEAAA